MKVGSKRVIFFILTLATISLTLWPDLARLTGQTGYEACAISPVKYDFGTATSPVESGYNRVCRSTSYTAGSFGWTNTNYMEDADRNIPADNLKRDICYSTQSRIFRTDIANGDYQVEYMMGDAYYAHDNMNIKANGTMKASNINTNLGQFVTGSFVITVSAGNLQLEFSDTGGTDPCWVINSIVLTPIVTKKYDFGTASSPLEPGYDRVTSSTSYTSGSYGWLDTWDMEDADRGAIADNLKRDLCFSRRPAIFRTDIANGLYLVEYTMGDAYYAHDNMIIRANGITISGLSSSYGQFITGSFTTTVTGGNLQIEFSDAGGVDPCWVINSIVIRPNIAPFATVTVSSTSTGGYSPYGAVDGVVNGYPYDNTKEWASNGEKANAWLQLNWSIPRTLRKIRMYDRINGNDWVMAYTLTWNGGWSSGLELPNMALTAPPAEVNPPLVPSSSWFRFTVDDVSSYTFASGLAEIEVYE